MSCFVVALLFSSFFLSFFLSLFVVDADDDGKEEHVVSSVYVCSRLVVDLLLKDKTSRVASTKNTSSPFESTMRVV